MVSVPVMREGIPSAPSPWRIVPMADYVVPLDDRASLIKKRWKTLHRLFGGAGKEAEVGRAEAELRALPNVRLANLVPPIDWSSALQAFAEAYAYITRGEDGRTETDENPSESGDHTPQFLVCQPYCDHAAIIEHWAARHRACVLQAPTASQILSGDNSWLKALPAGSGQPWVLPALERCFLRHANGLDLLRSFLEQALSGELGPGVIGCDSWAFAFVQRIWPLPGSPALTLQEFDGPALADYFVRSKRISGSKRYARFLSARSGEPLVPDEELRETDSDKSQDEREKCVPELRQLAAHCRGNPGVAWHYWRKRLRGEAEHDQKDRTTDREGGTPAAHVGGQGPDDIVWVAQDIETPSLPAETDEDVAFVLHTLLLHRGLTTDLLALLLPTPRARIASQLLRLQALGLLVREDERWQVAPLAYPTVREFLHARSYLIDAF
jgi:hypothetical protein